MKQKIRYYAGQDIEITWDPRRCIHSAECIHSLPEEPDDPTTIVATLNGPLAVRRLYLGSPHRQSAEAVPWETN